MRYDRDKVDEMVLALLYLTTNDNGTRAWKGMDWDAMDRLHDKGFIGNPKTKAKSVTLTEKGQRLSEEFFKKHFGLTS
jgi:predicted transcriptional regulator